MTSIFNDKENRDITVINILNTFIQTRVKEKKYMAIIKFLGFLVDILPKFPPKYKTYATGDKTGVNQLLARLQNSLYVTMVSSLLYYRKFAKIMTDIGF